jgi:hypothetical protein
MIAGRLTLASSPRALANQGLESRWVFRATIEWKTGMEARDVEAQALALAAQSLRYLGQACGDEAAKRRA